MSQTARLACVGGLLAAALALSHGAPAQPTQPVDGPRPMHLDRHAIVGATVVTAPGERLEDATILVEGDTIVAVGAGVAVPDGYRTWDASGHTVYPGLIEPWLETSVPAPDAASTGTHWNPMVRAQLSALGGTGFDAATRERMRGMGVAVAQLVPDDGLLRGTAAVVTMADDRPDDPAAHVVRTATGHVSALQTGRGRSSGYPGSKMGAIALLRQSLADAEWRVAATAAHDADPSVNPRPAADDAIAALGRDLPLMFAVGDELDALRVARVAEEFGRPAVIRGSGDEWRRLDAIVGTGLPFIVPAAIADAPAVDTVSDQRRTTLRDLIAWEQSPANLRRLLDAGVDTCLTTGSLPRGQRFAGNLRTIMQHGVSADEVLAAMTTTPARLLGIDDRYGTIRVGGSASFSVVDGELFTSDGAIRDLWVDGRRHEVSAAPAATLEGRWTVTSLDSRTPIAGTVAIEEGPKFSWTPEAASEDEPDAGDDAAEAAEAGEAGADDGEEQADTDQDEGPKPVRGTRVRRLENRVHAMLAGSVFGVETPVPVTAILEGETLHGDALLPGGRLVRWTGTPAEDADADDEGDGDADDESDDDEAAADTITVPDLPGLPIGAYGFDEVPAQETVVIRGATVWTSGPEGVITNGAVVLSDGVIGFVGRAADLTVPPGVRIIDGTGMHLTPGLIDCHSHTGISGGVNEGTDAVTCEVRIADVINPDDIDWYRQLAGGITAVNQLHGSANPIGGQNSVVKLRWGAAHPDDMRLEGARGGVKWALGENVKQSNWSGNGRYPQTRMGVEGIQRAMLIAGREYGQEMAAWNALPQAERDRRTPPRRDLELEAMAEMVAGDRLIHCHSYRQDEILMLCRLAGEFGFKIGTFQHVLEGYKVADAIAEHAIGGSCFSDWWAYKFEVFDAIPSNGAIMHDAGVVVSFNSDSDELARRMAAEAAKAVKYGGVPMEEALKFVTLNPAIQLGVADRIGSIEVGKDADVVLWTGHPLSSLSRVEQTFIDGREYFSRAADAALRMQTAAERDRIIALVIDGRDGGNGSGGARGRRGRGMAMLALADRDHDAGASSASDHTHSDEELAQLRAEWTFLMRNGIEPSGARPGDCGCTIHDLLLEDH